MHRDVKPGNVLITADGRPVLTDFGIATMAGDPALTSTGVVLGSPAYMSPERARGQRPGPAGDLWSLGATLYSAVEGRPPFDAPNALGTLTAVTSDPVEPPRVEGPLRDAILGLLAKDPADRLDIPTVRGLLQLAAADRTAEVTPVAPASTVVLDRASRTEALPLDGAPGRGAAARVDAPRQATTYVARPGPRRRGAVVVPARDRRHRLHRQAPRRGRGRRLSGHRHTGDSREQHTEQEARADEEHEELDQSRARRTVRASRPTRTRPASRCPCPTGGSGRTAARR